jgi:hypothetical protein
VNSCNNQLIGKVTMADEIDTRMAIGDDAAVINGEGLNSGQVIKGIKVLNPPAS